jgi:lipoic acid synthetase
VLHQLGLRAVTALNTHVHADHVSSSFALRAKVPGGEEYARLKKVLSEHKVYTVCEEANCPNLGECFSNGTATFMIMGEICTRRCPFCDVAHGKPKPLSEREPLELAEAIAEMRLRYVVITSVDRDDLKDSGAQHFANCISETVRLNPQIQVEVLVPDFRGRMEIALDILEKTPPHVFNHNLETVPRLYPTIRPGARYYHSLRLLDKVKQLSPTIFTKSGLMVGLGETPLELHQVFDDMRSAGVDFLTVGQYLQPTPRHAKVMEFVPPATFQTYAAVARSKGFLLVAASPLTRSSYHAGRDFAEMQARRRAAVPKSFGA